MPSIENNLAHNFKHQAGNINSSVELSCQSTAKIPLNTSNTSEIFHFQLLHYASFEHGVKNDLLCKCGLL